MANAIRRVNRRRRREPDRRVTPTLVAAIFVVGIWACSIGSASAHPEWSPIRINRYDKIVLVPTGARLVYTILYGDGPALPARKSVDGNADGRIDEREKAMLGVRALALVDGGLHVTLDGKLVRLPKPQIDVGLAGDAVGPTPFSIDLVFQLDAAPGVPHTLMLDDRVELPSEGDTEVSIEDAAPPALRGASQGHTAGADPQHRVFTFRGPRFSVLEDRTVTLSWQTSGAAPAKPRTLAIAIGAVLLALVAGAIALRRYRS